MTSKFQQELREAIKHWGTSLAINARSEEEDWKAVESLISQAVKRSEAECVICLSNLKNYPLGPGEPNIDVYKKALELACEHIEPMGTDDARVNTQYWIDLAEKEND